MWVMVIRHSIEKEYDRLLEDFCDMVGCKMEGEHLLVGCKEKKRRPKVKKKD